MMSEIQPVEVPLEGLEPGAATILKPEGEDQTGHEQVQGQTGNGQLCSKEEEIEEDAKRSECFASADALFQKSVADPHSNYATSFCEQISNKVNFCTVTFNQVCSSQEQIVDYQIGK